MFVYGVSISRVVRGDIAEALIIGALGIAAGIAFGRVVLDHYLTMPETMPDIGTVTSVAPLTYALAIIAGTAVAAAAPLLTLRRLQRTDISAALRVVE